MGADPGPSRPGFLLLHRLVRYTVAVIFAAALGALIVYCVGSYRGFPEDFQFTLVRWIMRISALLGTAAFLGLALDVAYIVVRKKTTFIAGIPGYALLLAAGFVLALGAAFVLSAAGGNR